MVASFTFAFALICVFITTVEYASAVTVSITIENKIINTTDARFVSMTIDTSQLTHTNPNQDLNLTNKQVIYLASQLSPSVLRIGGTQGDYTYYQVGDEDPCHLPSSSYHCLPMSEFDKIVSFAKQISADLVFGLSMGYPEYPTASTKVWNSSNTQQFLEHLAHTKHYTAADIHGFELGNEVNQGEPFKVPTVQANAFRALRALIDGAFGGSSDGSDGGDGAENGILLMGCDPHSYTLRENEADFAYIPSFVSDACPVLDALTYHCYVNQNSTQILSVDGLNEQYRESARVSNIFNNHTICPTNNALVHNIWAGEIAEHNNGGESQITNTFYDGFWYLDALGTLSDLGHAVFARQTFALSNYGLLNYDYAPNCDYFTALLFNNLMNENVLSVRSSDPKLRIYAHCGKPTDVSVTMAYINLYTEAMTIAYDTSVLGLTTGDLYVYVLTPSDTSAGLKSASMALNGVELKLNGDGKLPALNGKKVSVDGTIAVPKQSYGFFTFSDSAINLCH